MKCRSCFSNNLFVAVDLGSLPIAGELLNNINDDSDIFDSKLFICKDCGLGKISYDVDRSRLFEYYRFRTSYNKNFLEHSKEFVKYCIDTIGFNSNDWVLEIGSNDGYLLKIFKEYNIDVLGVDPSKNISLYAIANGIPTIVDFFGTEIAKEILRIKGYPKLIVAKNVLAHVPDINDFMNGISLLCNEETTVSIENPSIMNIIQNGQFDTIYHEHYSYLSALSVNNICKQNGLTLFNVTKNEMHGGSNRYFIGKNKNIFNSVNDLINDEIKNGIIDNDVWKEYNLSIKEKAYKFYKKVLDINNSGGIVCGYAASGKGSVIMNFAKIDKNMILSIADDSFEKQNKYMPGSNIPVVDIDSMLALKPTDIVVFAWNIYDQIKEKINNINKDIKIWIWDEE